MLTFTIAGELVQGGSLRLTLTPSAIAYITKLKDDVEQVG